MAMSSSLSCCSSSLSITFVRSPGCLSSRDPVRALRSCTPGSSASPSGRPFLGAPLPRIAPSFNQTRHVGGSIDGIRGVRPAALPILLANIFQDAWGPNVDASAISSTLFAWSLFPYLGFLYHLTRSKQTPPVALFGFYFLLAFVFATIPAGIIAKKEYGTALANVDWLHGGAESLLTVTNLLIVFGFRRGIRAVQEREQRSEAAVQEQRTEAAAAGKSASDGAQ